MTLKCISFPSSVWVRNSKYGWLTLRALERIVEERQQALKERQSQLLTTRENVSITPEEVELEGEFALSVNEQMQALNPIIDFG